MHGHVYKEKIDGHGNIFASWCDKNTTLDLSLDLYLLIFSGINTLYYQIKITDK